jgi:acyl-CoA thioesterase
MRLLTGPDTRLATLLDHPADEVRVDPTWWSFSGVHGGLSVALLVGALRRAVGADVPLRSVSAQFLRPVDGALRLEAEVLKRGRSVVVAAGTGRQEGRPHVTTSAVFGTAASGPAVPGPARPASPPIDEIPPLEMPSRTLPFFAHTEIRPVGDTRPFAGGDRAELVAWVRLVDDDRPVDDARLLVLLDCLPPAVAAVLPTMTPVPTIELGMQLSAARSAPSPWVLIRCHTDLGAADGWCTDRLDAWSPDGTHLATAHQLRLVLT